MSKNKDIQFEDIIENIVDNLEKPIFTYEEKYTCDEVWNNIKRNPFSKPIIYIFIMISLIITIIYFIIHKILKFIPINFLAFIIIYLLSFLIALLIKKKLIYRNPNCLYSKIYFYNNFLMVRKDKTFFKYNYDEILKIEDKNYYFIIYIDKYKYMIIENKKINKQSIEFLKKLQSHQENKQESKKENNELWKSIDKYIKGAYISSTNSVNEETINQYCNLKTQKKIIFVRGYIYGLLMTYIMAIIINPQFDNTTFNILFYLSIPIFILILNIEFMDKLINDEIGKLIKDNEKNSYNTFKLFLYDNFILLKKNIEIIKLEYSDIKHISSNEEYVFIKFKAIKSESKYVPIIVNINKLKKKKLIACLKNKNID